MLSAISQELAISILQQVKPLRQNASGIENLGYGWIYYGLIRSLKPKHTLVIGSGYGFTPIVCAIGHKDNEYGRVTFVDPGYAGLIQGQGVGKWKDPNAINNLTAQFSVGKFLTHYKMRNDEFFPSYHLPSIDIAIIDGSHDYRNAKYDIAHCALHLSKDGLLILHDSDAFANDIGFYGVREAIRNANLHFVNIPGFAGLAITQPNGGGFPNERISNLTKASIIALLLFGFGWYLGKRNS